MLWGTPHHNELQPVGALQTAVGLEHYSIFVILHKNQQYLLRRC